MTIRVDDEGPAGTVFPGPSGIAGTTPAVPAAPATAQFLVVALSGGLTQDRQLAAGTHISLTDGGPGGMLTVAADSIKAADVADFPGQNGDIAATAILAGAAAGMYAIMAAVTVSAAAGAGTIAAQANYTNGGARTAVAFSGFTVAATGTQGGIAVFQHTSGDINVSTTITGLVGTPTYEAHFRLVRLG